MESFISVWLPALFGLDCTCWLPSNVRHFRLQSVCMAKHWAIQGWKTTKSAVAVWTAWKIISKTDSQTAQLVLAFVWLSDADGSCLAASTRNKTFHDLAGSLVYSLYGYSSSTPAGAIVGTWNANHLQLLNMAISCKTEKETQVDGGMRTAMEDLHWKTPRRILSDHSCRKNSQRTASKPETEMKSM